jgi:cytochrome c-type biogenesis protein CcsB
MPVDAGLASLSDNLLLAALAAYVAAMFGYTLEYTFGRRTAATVAERAVAEPAKVLVGAGGPETVSVGRVVPDAPSRGPAIAGWAGVGATILGAALQAGCLITRALATHRFPLGNMYEFISAVCLVGVIGWLALALTRPVRHLGAFVLPLVLMLLGIAGSLVYTDAAPLMPALNSYWIKIHVPAAVSASGLFLVGFVLTVLYLIRDRADGRGVPSRLPDAATLERLSVRFHAIAFPIWTVAIILGAIWAESAWSRYWGWDPKETWAFVSWVVYAAYLHARATAGWRGRRAAYVALVGWATMLFNLFAVNLVFAGLHSYAGV